MSVTPQQILRRLSAVLSTDLGESTNLLDITAVLVLKNLLKNLGRCGSKVYPLLKIIVPYAVLLRALVEVLQRATFVQTAMDTAISYITAPLTATLFVPARHPLK